MKIGTLSKVTAKTAQELCQHFALSDEAKPLLKPQQTPAQLLEALVAKNLLIDAIRLLAHALPKREAVWWALSCARTAHGANPAPKIVAALQATDKWVLDPSEENRRAAWDAAEPAEFGTPAGCAAAGAFWSGGSLAPPNVPVVPPGEFLTAQGVAGAVLLAAVLTQPEKAADKHQQFLTLGADVGNGVNRWKGGK
jgi:hypothetical protein